MSRVTTRRERATWSHTSRVGGGYGHPRVWVPEAAGRARARERERESAARAMGACASRCAREETRGFGVVMSRGASSDAGGGRRADG